MKTKKTGKRGRPKNIVVKTPAKRGPKPKAAAPANYVPDQTGIMNVLNSISKSLLHLLDLSKAELFDAFRNYVQSRMNGGAQVSLEEFIAMFAMILAKHAISDEDLISALSPHQKDYLFECAKRAESFARDSQVSAPKPAAAKPLAPVPLIRTVNVSKVSGVQVQEQQASKINVDDFGLGSSNGNETTTQPAGASQGKSVFSDLDVL